MGLTSFLFLAEIFPFIQVSYIIEKSEDYAIRLVTVRKGCLGDSFVANLITSLS